jgi:hypothetical protein
LEVVVPKFNADRQREYRAQQRNASVTPWSIGQASQCKCLLEEISLDGDGSVWIRDVTSCPLHCLPGNPLHPGDNNGLMEISDGDEEVQS